MHSTQVPPSPTRAGRFSWEDDKAFPPRPASCSARPGVLLLRPFTRLSYLEHAERLVERAREIVVRESVLLEEVLADQTRDLEHHL